ncbi:hypothetical protein TNCV_1428681 [Trichonephila clavipes]|nr:hypothetical protein TNCV_1428681 [Trichonephila clavipes]
MGGYLLLKLCSFHLALVLPRPQRQTFQTVGIYLPRLEFSHGMLNAVFSRATSIRYVRVSVNDTKKQGKLNHSNKMFAKNVVLPLSGVLNSSSLSTVDGVCAKIPQAIYGLTTWDEIRTNPSRSMHCEVQESPHLLRNEKQKLTSFRSGTGARDLVPKWEHFARLQFLDDTIQPLDSISNLDNMELEVNVTSLNVSDEDLFENDVELPPIPNRAPSESELPQRIRVFTSTPPVTTSTPRARKRKVESSQEAFYESMEKCLGAVGKKNSQ